MAVELFGYRFGKIGDEIRELEKTPSFAPKPNDDGAIEINGYGTFLDFDVTVRNDNELVTKYRQVSMEAEVESAIDDIINELLIREDNKSSVEINLDKLEVSDKIKTMIRDEFKTVLQLLDFDNMGYDIIRRWYIDGRVYYHKMIDEKAVRDGIKEIRYIDPRRIRKIREAAKKEGMPQARGNVGVVPPMVEYFLYSPAGLSNSPVHTGIKISTDSIAFVHSGLMDSRNKAILSHVHKAIKPMNQLRMLEDAVVIYRLARAPERRVFYIDTGNLPKIKAEQHLRDVMVRHKNKLTYSAETGEIVDGRKMMTMLEDFWIPRREGGRGTEITTLPGGQNLSQIEDVEYFKQKVYKSLNVPITRLQSDNAFNLGRSGEITRDEIKFSRFIDRLRGRFCQLFDDLLETQLILRGIINRADWKNIEENIHYDFLRDNYFAEQKEQEIMNSRVSIIQNIDPYVGKYFSIEYIRRQILKLSEEEIKEMNKEIEIEDSMTPALDDPNQAPQQQQVRQPQQSIRREQYIPKKELTEEEQELVTKMTKVIDGALDLTEEEQELVTKMTKVIDGSLYSEDDLEVITS